jgi:hypothetical protein
MRQKNLIEFRRSLGRKMTDALTHSISYDYVELAALLANGKMVRGRHVRVSNPNAIVAWVERFDRTDVFTSAGSFRAPNNNSACILPLYFDIDCPNDLPATRESALTLCQLLMDRACIPEESLDICFSGAKGFHVVVAPEVFRAFSSPYTLGLYRKLAEKASEVGVRFLDYTAYSRKKLWRLSNTRHRRSGLFKTPLRYQELRDISMEGILRLAASLRPDDTFARPQVCEAAAAWFQTALAAYAGQQARAHRPATGKNFKRGWRMPPCVKAIEAAILPDGVRHHTYFALARAFRRIGMHPDEIQERLETLDCRNPIRDSDYIGRTIEWACAHPGFPGCHDASLRQYCHPDACFYIRIKKNAGGK